MRVPILDIPHPWDRQLSSEEDVLDSCLNGTMTEDNNDSQCALDPSSCSAVEAIAPGRFSTSINPQLGPYSDSNESSFLQLLEAPREIQPRSRQSLNEPVELPAYSIDSIPVTPRQSHNSTPQASPQPRYQRPSLSPYPLSETWQLSLSQLSINSNEQEAAPYNVADEETPEAPFYKTDFQNALRKGMCLTKNVAEALERLGISTESRRDLNRLQKDAKELSNFESVNMRTIAVLGDSGEGKSSLINSLLHFPGIAKTGDIGSACTSVVTEYRQKTNRHTAPITLEVEYLSQPKINELVRELVWGYRQIYLPDIEERATTEEYKRYEAESDRAWSALEAAFGDKLRLRAILQDDTEGALERITDQLIQWSTDLNWPQGGNDGIWIGAAETAEECCDKTAVFMCDKFWPFTKVIRVYLDSQVLKNGIVLADLPGLHDTNLARVRNTEQYLLRSDFIFIVAKISRAITDCSLKSSLYTALRHHVPLEWEESAAKYLNIAVVCTKSEDINIKSQLKEFCGPGKRISQAVIENIDLELQQAKEANNTYLKKTIKRRREMLLMNARNSHVKEGLQRAYSAKISEGRLNVFCVSNTVYEKACRKGISEYVDASGIPELRKFCHSITARVQYMEATHFLQSKIPCLINSVRLWAGTLQDHPANKKIEKELLEGAQSSRQKVMKSVDVFKSNLSDTFHGQFGSLMEARHRDWKKEALKRSKEWESWHHSQYDAWCRHEGTYYTRKCGRHRWNALLIWRMQSEQALAWGLIQEEIPTSFDTMMTTVKNALLDMKLVADKYADAFTFGQSIQLRITSAQYILSADQRKVERELKLIYRNASEDSPSSYILEQMIPAYRLASQQHDDGRKKRQHAIIRQKIKKGALFPNLSFTIKQHVEELIDVTFADIRDQLQGVLESIRSDLNMAMAHTSMHTVSDSEIEDRHDFIERLAGFEAELKNVLEMIPRCTSDILAN